MANKKMMRRKAAQAVTHLMDAGTCLFELREVFLPVHPQYAEFFDWVITSLTVIIEQLKKVFTLAWGYFPDDLSKWMH